MNKIYLVIISIFLLSSCMGRSKESSAKAEFAVRAIKELDSKNWSADAYKALKCPDSYSYDHQPDDFKTFAQAGGIKEIIRVETKELSPDHRGTDTKVRINFNRPVYLEFIKKEALLGVTIAWEVRVVDNKFCLDMSAISIHPGAPNY